MINLTSFYDSPRIYDLAFSYRDYNKELGFLLNTYSELKGRSANSLLEIAAGPAGHALAAAKKGLDASALDLAEPMMKFAKEKSESLGVKLTCHVADMTNFHLNRKYDLIVTMIDSLSHLKTPQALLEHLSSVGQHLSENGLYIIESAHPKGLFEHTETTVDIWECSEGDESIQIRWEGVGDIEPISQLCNYQAKANYKKGKESHELKDDLEVRFHTYGEFDLAISVTDNLKLVKTFGNFEGDPVNSKNAWRLILVVERK